MSLNPNLYALLSETPEPTQATAQYVWGARPGHRDELILRDRAADRLYCLMDYFDPTAVIDPTGAVVERYGWSAFGQRRVMDADWEPLASSAAAFDFGFHGQFLDSDTGYYNYGYRYYSPEIGRWLSRDPIGERGGSNLYEIAFSNLLNRLDLYGLSCCSYDRINVVIWYRSVGTLGNYMLNPKAVSEINRIFYNCIDTCKCSKGVPVELTIARSSADSPPEEVGKVIRKIGTPEQKVLYHYTDVTFEIGSVSMGIMTFDFGTLATAPANTVGNRAQVILSRVDYILNELSENGANIDYWDAIALIVAHEVFLHSAGDNRGHIHKDSYVDSKIGKVGGELSAEACKLVCANLELE